MQRRSSIKKNARKSQETDGNDAANDHQNQHEQECRTLIATGALIVEIIELRTLHHDGRDTIKHETASSGVNVTMTPGDPSAGLRSRLAGIAIPPEEQSARTKV